MELMLNWNLDRPLSTNPKLTLKEKARTNSQTCR